MKEKEEKTCCWCPYTSRCLSRFTFAEVFGVEREAVSGQRLQQQLVAGPPARLGDGGGHALHGGHALEERRLAVEADQLVELGQDAVALDLLLLRQLQLRRQLFNSQKQAFSLQLKVWPDYSFFLTLKFNRADEGARFSVATRSLEANHGRKKLQTPKCDVGTKGKWEASCVWLHAVCMFRR